MHVTRSYSNHTYRSSNFEAKNCHLEAQCVLVCKLDLKLSYEISIHPCNLCLFWSWSHAHTAPCKGYRSSLLWLALLFRVITGSAQLRYLRHHLRHLFWRPKRSTWPISQTPEHPTGTWHTEDTAHAIGYQKAQYIIYMHLASNRHLTYWILLKP